MCHGSVGVGRRPYRATSVPDLRYMTMDTHKNFKNIVLKGYKKPNGMLPFEGIISDEDVEAVHAFLVDWQWKLYKEQNNTKE